VHLILPRPFIDPVIEVTGDLLGRGIPFFKILKLIQKFVIELIEDLLGPALQDAEIDQEALTIQRFGRNRNLNEKIVAVERLALSADLAYAMGGGKGFLDRHLVHPFFPSGETLLL